jgi:hypothetical protein
MDTLANAYANVYRQELDRFGRELGMPDGMTVISFTMDAGELKEEWRGYALEFFGDAAPLSLSPKESATSATSATEGLPNFIYAECEGVAMRVWCIRVRHSGAQAYLEARTRPGWLGFAPIDLRDVDPSNRGDNERMLAMGTAMLYPRVFRSRPQGSGRFATAEEFHAAYRDANAALKLRGVKPRMDLILHEMGISKSSFYEHKHTYGLGE